MTHMDKGVNVVIRHHVLLSRLNVNGHHDKFYFVTKQAVFQVTVDRKQGCIIQLGLSRALLEINREESEAMHICFSLRLAPCKRQKLENVETILRAEAVVA